MNPLAERLRTVMALDATAPAIEFEQHWYTWGDVGRTAAAVAETLAALGAGPGSRVGVLLRNRPVPVGLALGVLAAEACLVTVNPLLGVERVQRDLVDLDLAAVAGEPDDIAALVTDAVRARSAVVTLDDLGGHLACTPAPGSPSVPLPEPLPGVAVRMLTSGTTGPPSRIDLTDETLWRVMEGAKHYESSARADVRLRDGVVVVNSPMVHLGGLFRVVQAVCDGRKFALLERFRVDTWADAVRRHQPRTVSLVPSALRMVLDADLDPADLASVRSVISGTAPLDPDLADAFTERYGVPVLTSYAATEFGGGVAGWNLADHERFGVAKRGSVGRAHAGCALRVVDEATGAELDPDAVGLLEVRTAQIDPDRWIRTTDLARLDADGFLWIVGRADQTILRGGFKVQPETVRTVLARDPEVVDAVVLGVPDERLGAVPVAVVERVPGTNPRPEDLIARASAALAPYEVPTRVVVVDALVRTASAKVDLTAARALFDAAD